ncbi:scyllo-inositol 2-dehydrogenase (NAD(+)) [Bacillus licheniformis]|nr:scyllo-inositol 2-dehydrogenase (NAD(+)) [Bacillus licheniformis]
MTEVVRCAVLGLGRLGYYHAKNLKTEVPGVLLAAVADPAEVRGRLQLNWVLKSGLKTRLSASAIRKLMPLSSLHRHPLMPK